MAEDESKLDPVERDDHESSRKARAYRRRPFFGRHSCRAVSGWCAQTRCCTATMAAARPLHFVEGPRRGGLLLHARCTRIFRHRSTENLHGSAVDAEWASRPEQAAWGRGEYRTARSWAADCRRCGARRAYEAGIMARVCAHRRWRIAGRLELGSSHDSAALWAHNLTLIVDRNRI